MDALTTIKAAVASTGLPVATGVYDGPADHYIVLTPLNERNDEIADDAPLTESEGVDVNLYYKGDYRTTKNQLVSLLRAAGLIIVDRRWITYNPETGRHQYVITVEKKEVL